MAFSIWPTESRVGAYQDDYSDRVREAQLSNWILDRGRTGLDSFVVDGLDLTSGTGLTVDIASGRAIIRGYIVVNSATYTIAVTDDATNYLWLSLSKSSSLVLDGTFTANTTGVAPSVDSVLLGKAVLVGGSTTCSTSLKNPRILTGTIDPGDSLDIFLGLQPYVVINSRCSTLDGAASGFGVGYSIGYGFGSTTGSSLVHSQAGSNGVPTISSYGFTSALTATGIYEVNWMAIF